MLKTKKQLNKDAYEMAMIAVHCQFMEDELDIKYFKSFNETTREFLKESEKKGLPLYTVIALLKDREKILLKAYEKALNIFEKS